MSQFHTPRLISSRFWHWKRHMIFLIHIFNRHHSLALHGQQQPQEQLNKKKQENHKFLKKLMWQHHAPSYPVSIKRLRICISSTLIKKLYYKDWHNVLYLTKTVLSISHTSVKVQQSLQIQSSCTELQRLIDICSLNVLIFFSARSMNYSLGNLWELQKKGPIIWTRTKS